ncbi:MAG TPA: hypothetical protein VJH37_00235 [Candidatus Nanoarchaeia archaeon]|nr:hypothetical protein [Candidatus Nanoarchaeia archaeon]
MRGKKGLDYIDWSISMGMFIIAVTALFVFLKPGAHPESDQETLVKIVEKNFLEQAQWFIHETPLYVKHFQDLYGTGQQALIHVRAEGNIRFSAVRPASHGRYELITQTPRQLTFNCNIAPCDDSNFTIIGTTERMSDTIDLEYECIPANQPLTCTAILGATITYEGLQQAEINTLSTANYNTIRSSWMYPLQKEFAIYQDGNKIIGGQEPVQQGNIFVKELKMQVINAQGVKTPTVINIKVW